MKYQNNHAAALRGQQHYNRKQVLFLTGLTDQQLTQMQMFLLSEWLCFFHPQNTPDYWMRSKGLWEWWLYMWNDWDEEILPVLYTRVPENDTAARYAYYRKTLQLVFNIRFNPKAAALYADFNSLSSDFEKEIKKASCTEAPPAVVGVLTNHTNNTGL